MNLYNRLIRSRLNNSTFPVVNMPLYNRPPPSACQHAHLAKYGVRR